MTWKVWSIPAAASIALVAGVFSGRDLDQRIPVGPGGSIAVDLELGAGIAFDYGSLTIRSHEAEDVRIESETTGWGRYAVDFDLSRDGEHVELVGRVDGLLDWMFGGPTVDVSVWVPRDFAVEARIEGGPLVLEDLAGPISAEVEDTDVTLRRAEGPVRIASDRGAIEVEDVEGDLQIRTRRGEIDVTGVRGAVNVTTDRGDVEIASVTGRVDITSGSGSVEIDGVRGDISVKTDRGRIEAEDIEGDIDARTGRGGIQLQEIDGAVHAQSRRGSIEVTFEGDPRGEIETERGSIEIEVDEGASFTLDARTERGDIRIGDDAGDPDDGDLDDLGADDQGDGDRERGLRLFRDRDEELVREINGGGDTLRLRTGRGSIRIRD